MFKSGEICQVSMGRTYHYGIVIQRNRLKLRSNFYHVLIRGKVMQVDYNFIERVED